MDNESARVDFSQIASRLPEGGASASLAQRLAKRFGWGDNPTKRRVLYDRIERAVEKHGEKAEALVAEAAMQAQVLEGRRDRYFCRAVVAKLREAGYWTTPFEQI